MAFSFRISVASGMAVLGMAVSLAVAPVVLAYNESGTVDPYYDDCADCHAGDYSSGPHGGYLTTSRKCGNCHLIHSAPPSALLLPSSITQGTCETCHDGTGGKGVYGAMQARGVPAVGRHRIDVTRTVPGGASSGGSSVATFTGENRNLSCGDCHSAHGTSVVATFVGDRARISTDTTGFGSTRLLRRGPGGTTPTISVYGSDWCARCHVGRTSASRVVHNHPTDSYVLTTSPFYYQRVAVLTTETAQTTTMGPLGRSNRGYLMPYPRTVEQSGHAPVCQQCHEDRRSVGVSGAVEYFRVTSADGSVTSDNPRFQTFPHETANALLLLEVAEDLCTNCHPNGSGMP